MTRTSASSPAPERPRAAARTPAELLAAPTPAAWYEAAAADLALLLNDHASCEKKAASTALALMFAYGDDAPLALALSRLAREELRHFEQVQRLMQQQGVAQRRLRPGRYAEGLRAAVRAGEPARRLDLLVCGAFIEARSCERFAGLWPRLPAAIGDFYRGLEASESRHFGLYLRLAGEHAAGRGADLAASVERFAAVEAELATAPDPLLRFHSGPPA